MGKLVKNFNLLPLFLFAVAGSASAVSGDDGYADRFVEVSETEVVLTDTVALPSVLTFGDCLERALAHSTDMREALLSMLQADEEIGSARDAWLPEVGFSTSHSFSNYPSPAEGVKGNVYNSSYGIDASWTVWEGNVRKYRLESARISRNIRTLAGESVVKDLTLAVLQAYLNIMYAREAVDIARLTLEVSTQQTDRCRRLMEAGRISKVEYAQIESQNAQDRYAVVQAESNLSSALLEMKKLLNLGIGYTLEIAPLEFADSDIDVALPASGAVYEYAASWLPEIQSNELTRDVYANDIKIAKAGRMPKIALQGGVGTGYTSGGPGWGSQMGHGFNEKVGVSLSVPIYDANSTNRAVAKARLASLEYDIERDRLLSSLSQTLESLYIDAQTSRGKYHAGTSRLESANVTAQLVDRQFELGLVNPLELLTAHNDLLTARLEQLQNKFMAILANKTIEFYATRSVVLP